LCLGIIQWKNKRGIGRFHFFDSLVFILPCFNNILNTELITDPVCSQIIPFITCIKYLRQTLIIVP